MQGDDQGGGRVFTSGPDGTTTIDGDERPGQDGLSDVALGDMSFSTHVLSLNAMALMSLGEMEGLPSGEVDLDSARHVVDTLLMLREKTEGNLTVEEQRMLDAILYDLRLKVVRAQS